MYDVAVVIGSALLSLGICWFGLSMDDKSQLRVFKPLFLFIGFGFIIITLTLSQMAATAGGASTGMVDLLGTAVIVAEWTYVTALSIYMVVLLYNLLSSLLEKRKTKKWGEREI